MLATAGREDTDDAQTAADMVPIGARVAGQVTRVNIVENQRVKRGDLLIEIDPSDYDARVQQAEAELATAKAQAEAAQAQVEIVEATSKGGLATARAALSGSAAGVQSATAQMQAARADMARADAELKKAEIDLQRARTLRAANAVPQERLDSAQIAYDSAKAAKAQAEAQVALAEDTRRSAESRVGEARGRVSQSAPVAPQIAAARANADLANARIRSAEAALALAKLQLGYTKVTAPADGFASKLTVHAGQLVTVGQPLIELVPTTTYVIANFKETQIGQMKVGQPAKIEIDALPGPHVRRQGREPGRRHGRQLLAVARRQRHRQLRQGRAAGPGAHRLDEPTDRRGFARGSVRRRHRRRAKVTAMHNGIRSCAALAALVATTAVAHAASRTLTIDEAVALALRSNPRLAAARARAESGEVQATSTGRRMLPSIHVSDEAQYWNAPFAVAFGPMALHRPRPEDKHVRGGGGPAAGGPAARQRRADGASRAERRAAGAGGRRRVRPARHRRDPVPARVRGAGAGTDRRRVDSRAGRPGDRRARPGCRAA